LKPQYNTVIQSHSSKILAMAESLGSEKENPMQMRLKKGRWYAAFSYKGKWQGKSLNAYKHQEKDAVKNLTRLYDSLERGENPTDLKRKVKDAIPFYKEWEKTDGEKSQATIKENQGRIKKHIITAFGDLTIGEITPTILKRYKVDREEQNAPKSTVTKELRVIKDICELFNPRFKMPKFKKWANRGKRETGVLTESDIFEVSAQVLNSSEEFGATYQQIFKLMYLTGLSISDAINLERSQIGNDDFVYRQRNKTGEDVLTFIGSKAWDVINSVKTIDLKNPDRIFTVPGNKSVATAINRAFKKAGVNGSSKSLRHFAGSALLDAGVPEKVIGLILGHAPGSRITGVYLHAQKKTIKKGFQAIDILVGGI
jgi:integrase